MNLKSGTIEELKKIMNKDYHTKLTNDEAGELGLSLLRLTRLGIINTVQKINTKAENHQIQEILEPNKRNGAKSDKVGSVAPI